MVQSLHDPAIAYFDLTGPGQVVVQGDEWTWTDAGFVKVPPVADRIPSPPVAAGPDGVAIPSRDRAFVQVGDDVIGDPTVPSPPVAVADTDVGWRVLDGHWLRWQAGERSSAVALPDAVGVPVAYARWKGRDLVAGNALYAWDGTTWTDERLDLTGGDWADASRHLTALAVDGKTAWYGTDQGQLCAWTGHRAACLPTSGAVHAIAVADGTVWFVDRRGLASVQGGAVVRSDLRDVSALAAGPGLVAVSTPTDTRIWRDAAWKVVGAPADALAVGPDGALYAARAGRVEKLEAP